MSINNFGVNTLNVVDPGFYLDSHRLENIKQEANQTTAIKKLAPEFEAFFFQMLFKEMRKSNAVFESELMGSTNKRFFEEMYDQQLAMNLGQQGHLGIADLFVKQLAPKKISESSEKNLLKSPQFPGDIDG